MSNRTWYGPDGLIHDEYGDNTSYHRVGGTYRMSPWWYNRDKKKPKGKKRKTVKRKH